MTWPRIESTSYPIISPLTTLVTDGATIIIKIVGDGQQGEKDREEGGMMEGRGAAEGGRNRTFGGFGFDVCNPNTCLGADTLTVNMMSDTEVQSIKVQSIKV